ncbi:YIP1 family protein [Halolamina sp. CBA1230]|uniref:YIP1 family protein n=1 Tax=Halolamina sp. CBA1230 TaxID=1853690 RepID=UPI0009A1E747|nr:YIP1 family protein [Halolamina sp. CBA1230]QKY19765.1 YIP1 family protein [Halolamina sp. CBA1230]
MTQWIGNPEGGRGRGPRALARAWAEVLVRPRRFFRNGIAPADQAPGLVFGVLVALGAVGGRLATGDMPTFETVEVAPPFGLGSGPLGAVLVLLGVGLFLAPAAFHLSAALETVGLALLAPDRAGVSETVQVIAYATAPCLLTAVPWAPLRVVCCLYGAGLLIVGTAVRHRTSIPRAALAAALPAVIVFGYGYGGFAAAGL